jgi:hypothetical protein
MGTIEGAAQEFGQHLWGLAEEYNEFFNDN